MPEVRLPAHMPYDSTFKCMLIFFFFFPGFFLIAVGGSIPGHEPSQPSERACYLFIPVSFVAAIGMGLQEESKYASYLMELNAAQQSWKLSILWSRHLSMD